MKKEDHWFYKAREGERGPFNSEEEATAALKKFILESQKDRVPGTR